MGKERNAQRSKWTKNKDTNGQSDKDTNRQSDKCRRRQDVNILKSDSNREKNKEITK